MVLASKVIIIHPGESVRSTRGCGGTGCECDCYDSVTDSSQQKSPSLTKQSEEQIGDRNEDNKLAYTGPYSNPIAKYSM